MDNCDQILSKNKERFSQKIKELSYKLKHAKFIFITLNNVKIDGLKQKIINLSPLSKKSAAKLLLNNCKEWIPQKFHNIDVFSQEDIFESIQRTPRNILIISQLMETYKNINTVIQKFLSTEKEKNSQSNHVKELIEFIIFLYVFLFFF